MPHLATAHCAKIGLTFTHSTVNVSCELTLAVQDNTDAIFANASAFATQCFTAVVARLVPQTTNVVVWNGVVFEDVRTVPYGGAFFAQTPTAGTLGTTTTALPTGTAFAVKKLTGSYGRSHRGRLFWPVWDATHMSAADTYSSTRANALLTALAALQADIEGGALPCKVGIISQQEGKVTRANGLFEQITGWTYADLTIDEQRRRLLGRGR